MIRVRHSSDRGYVLQDWLESYHSFSFGQYQDPEHTGIGNLCVINEDRIAPGRGFGMHGHSDMEIVTYVLEGALEHRDSLGNGAVIRPGEVQYMSAGTGIQHSEHNPSTERTTHLLQIWLRPSRLGVAPGYGQRDFPCAERRGRLVTLVSPDGRDGSLATHQPALLLATLLGPGESVEYAIAPGRQAYVQVARGRVRVGGEALGPGDAAHLAGEPGLRLEGEASADVLLFDLPLEDPAPTA